MFNNIFFTKLKKFKWSINKYCLTLNDYQFYLNEFSNFNCFLREFQNGNIFFFAGSGISLNSNMPSVGQILYKTAKVFLPKEELSKLIVLNEKSYKIQPEIFYENILYVVKSINSLLFWKSLSPNYLREYDFKIIPNINHLAIVKYSFENNLPIFTTNFDILFEYASKMLNINYKVILPYTKDEVKVIKEFKNSTIDKTKVYIFKLHGTIEKNNIDTLDSLHTTMNSISKINLNIINFIYYLTKTKNITFLGYSGRDIDYFPEIKKIDFKLPTFWISKFNDYFTKENSNSIKAIKIFNYPNEIFKYLFIDLNIDNKLNTSQNKIFRQLQIEIENRINLTNSTKKLILGLLLQNIGEYKKAYNYLLKLNKNNDLEREKKIILLLSLSQLAHENSKYIKCGEFAKEALKISKNRFINYKIISLCQISESKRMSIAHDNTISYKQNYIKIIFVLFSFIKNFILIKFLNLKLDDLNMNNISYIMANHNYIEHKIRFFALTQSVLKKIIDKKIFLISKLFKLFLIRIWDSIEMESKAKGYSQGIANSYKFKVRIDKNIEHKIKSDFIYNLSNSKTGLGLSFRNEAELLFEKREFQKAKEMFYKFLKESKSGNNLNGVKALLGIAKCNIELKENPLSKKGLTELKNLMNEVEGSEWKKYFEKVLSYISNFKKES